MPAALPGALLSSAAVSLVSLVGLVALPFDADTVSFWLAPAVGMAVGALLGDAFLHLLPDVMGLPSAPAWTLAGLAASFVLERALRLHHEPHAAGHGHSHVVKPTGPVLLLGCGIHNLVDGALVGASYLHSLPMGLATTAAVCLHELPHELGDFAVLLDCGYSRARALLYNFLTACLAVAGTLLVFAWTDVLRHSGAALALTAGQFIYVACADLMPEMQAERSRTRAAMQTAGVLLGLALMWALKRLG
ncbi:MAG: ZIP family metal transporter [Elusimicrobia bacterium]|nr:ZIP family metal transporter [Elusimicrobiota bacterium]